MFILPWCNDLLSTITGKHKVLIVDVCDNPVLHILDLYPCGTDNRRNCTTYSLWLYHPPLIQHNDPSRQTDSMFMWALARMRSVLYVLALHLCESGCTNKIGCPQNVTIKIPSTVWWMGRFPSCECVFVCACLSVGKRSMWQCENRQTFWSSSWAGNESVVEN